MESRIEALNKCRLCFSNVRNIINLCNSPPANNFVEDYSKFETIESFPLEVEFCDECKNIQLSVCLDEDLLYKNYNYLTPVSKSLENHYQYILSYVEEEIGALQNLSILEVGSNTGELLKFFKPYVKNILGIDPAENVSKIANEKGIKTVNAFFNSNSLNEINSNIDEVDLIIARHMFAHNNSPSFILDAARELLGSNKGHLIIENAYAIDTFLNGELDQIYHEHMFFYSALSMKNLLASHGFTLFDILFSKVHGGSALFIATTEDKEPTTSLKNQLELELDLFHEDKIFNLFKQNINNLKTSVLEIISDAIKGDLDIIAYGAPAKAFTMFSFLDLSSKIISYAVDTTPTKIGKTFPISEIKIVSESSIDNSKNKLIFVTAWNYREEIIQKAQSIFCSGDILLFPLPELYIHRVN